MQRYLQKYGKRVLLPSALIIGLLYFFLQQNHSATVEIIPATVQLEQASENDLEEIISVLAVVVDVKGQVKFPGVYELTEEHRIIDAIQLAGGYTEQADTKMINHAQRLQDEMVIYVPFQGEEMAEINFVSHPNGQNKTPTKVNINTADEALLMTIPGIGSAKAQAIISYRNEAGKFQTIDDIKKVSGIGEKSFERIKDLIKVN
ncbi:hypothetical protein A0U40_14165 [[Bacillus] sp. KCTC 13219]|nr:hypothetical protein A0U40_14165 [[Bacillus] sp. KCTC 13219]